jgi:hypothetical protein
LITLSQWRTFHRLKNAGKGPFLLRAEARPPNGERLTQYMQLLNASQEPYVAVPYDPENAVMSSHLAEHFTSGERQWVMLPYASKSLGGVLTGHTMQANDVPRRTMTYCAKLTAPAT